MKSQLSTFFLLLIFSAAFCQAPPKPYGPIPTAAQLNWQETEMYCIIHYGPDTYTDKEWGYGDENPDLINLKQFDAMGIVSYVRFAGFKGIVVVAKHHDGFCLWPTKTTEHNISKSPYKNGKGDIVEQYRKACDQWHMKMGIYCSPWDRNSALYGTPAYVTDVFRKQLQELYTNYGPLFLTWFDGANGGDGYYGGTKEKRVIDRSTYYDWPVTWNIVRTLQPGAAIFGDVGPDVRWVGDEQGMAGEPCWETYTPHAPDSGKMPGNGYVKSDEGINGQRDGKYWMPAECDVPLRPGWFYHQNQDSLVKSPDSLFNIYMNSVGRGACLDLGLAPNREGKLSYADKEALYKFKTVIEWTFGHNLADNATFEASNVRYGNQKDYGTNGLLGIHSHNYWATDDSVTAPTLIISLPQPKTFDIVELKENIKLGQRIEAFAIDAWLEDQWQQVAQGTSIGYKRLIRLNNNITTQKLRLRIIKSPASIALSNFGLYEQHKYTTGNEMKE